MIISRVRNVHCSRWKDCLSLGMPEYGVRSELVGFEYKRIEYENEWEHKAKEGNIGIHEAELIDCNIID